MWLGSINLSMTISFIYLMSMQSLAQPPRYYNPSHVPNKIARLKSMAPKENFRRLRRTHKELQDINLNLALDLYIWSLEYKVSHTAMDELWASGIAPPTPPSPSSSLPSCFFFLFFGYAPGSLQLHMFLLLFLVSFVLFFIYLFLAPHFLLLS